MKSFEEAEPLKENFSKSSKPPSPGGCKPNVHPQQQELDFDELTLDSRFDSGNMASAVKFRDTQYHIWVASDCTGTSKETDHRTWFYFRVKNVKKLGTYTFTIKNMNNQTKLYGEGLRPVFKTNAENSTWKRMDDQNVVYQKVEKGMEVIIKYTFDGPDQEAYFAFTYPWSYEEDQALMSKYEQEFKDDSEIYFNRELLAFSRENRRIDHITITSHSKKLDQREKCHPNLFPEGDAMSRPFIFDKKYVFISSRVHPGETPASYVFKGLLRFLLDKQDPRAQALRDNFVMVLVPILNPDGVYRGHYRSDTQGLNLNRYYINPSVVEHPSIYATRQIIMELSSTKRLFLYCDLHAHASKKGCFVYGNNLEFRQQVESLMFPKMLSLNSQCFEFDACNFSESNVNVRDRGDGKNKEGAGRVALHKATNLASCYTLECNYSSGKYRNVLSNPKNQEGLASEEAKIIKDEGVLGNLCTEKIPNTNNYTIEDFEEVGEGIGPALLDMINVNPSSRISNSVYKTVKNVKLALAVQLMKEPPFKFDTYLRKINKTLPQNVDALIKYLDENTKAEPRRESKSEKGYRIVKKANTLTPQNRTRVLKEVKENTGIQEIKKTVKVITLLPPIKKEPEVTTSIRKINPQERNIIKKRVIGSMTSKVNIIVRKKIAQS